MSIPKIIHQTAHERPQPSEIEANIERLQALNPGWEYRFYTTSDILTYIAKHCDARTQALCARVNPRYYVVLADLFRYIVCHREGGVYLDIKSGMNQPLDAILQPDDAYILSQWQNRLSEKFSTWGLHSELRIPGGEFQNWHIISKPGHPYLARVIDNVLFNMQEYNVGWFSVGKLGVIRLSGPISYSLSIAPMLARHPVRMIDAEQSGLIYSIYANPYDHMAGPNHYSRCLEPIMIS